MAMNVGERRESRLEVDVKAKNLAAYTIQITKNTKIFLPEYQTALTNDLIHTAKEIFTDVWKANNIKVMSQDTWRERERLQMHAANDCNDMLATIQLAKTVFHLRSKRVRYWAKQCIEVRKLIRAWHEKDKERYKRFK